METRSGFDTRICCHGSLGLEMTTTTNAESRRKNLSLMPNKATFR
jgi:hypothetical protein